MKERLRAARRQTGLSQAQVAKSLGINQSSVSQWETGRSRPEDDRLPDLAALYRVPVDWLEDADGGEPPILIQNKSERELLTIFRRLTAEQRETVLNMVRAVIPR